MPEWACRFIFSMLAKWNPWKETDIRDGKQETKNVEALNSLQTRHSWCTVDVIIYQKWNGKVCSECAISGYKKSSFALCEIH